MLEVNSHGGHIYLCIGVGVEWGWGGQGETVPPKGDNTL